MDRTVSEVLRWSVWRRWHQAWAQYHHYRRRGTDEKRVEEGMTVVKVQEEEKAPRNRLEEWEIDVVWGRLELIVVKVG